MERLYDGDDVVKTYLARFKKNNQVAYKTGHTKWFKSIKRFEDSQYDIFDEVKIMDDILIQHEDARVARICARLVEACLQAVFPKNFRLEEHFLTEEGVFDGLNGITEMFILKEGQTEKDVLELFRRVKRNVGFVMEGKEEW